MKNYKEKCASSSINTTCQRTHNWSIHKFISAYVYFFCFLIWFIIQASKKLIINECTSSLECGRYGNEKHMWEEIWALPSMFLCVVGSHLLGSFLSLPTAHYSISVTWIIYDFINVCCFWKKNYISYFLCDFMRSVNIMLSFIQFCMH